MHCRADLSEPAIGEPRDWIVKVGGGMRSRMYARRTAPAATWYLRVEELELVRHRLGTTAPHMKRSRCERRATSAYRDHSQPPKRCPDLCVSESSTLTPCPRSATQFELEAESSHRLLRTLLRCSRQIPPYLPPAATGSVTMAIRPYVVPEK